MGKEVNLKQAIQIANEIAENSKSDVFLFNGLIDRSCDLEIIESIHQCRSRLNAILFLITNGGDPDSAYKIARYFQDRYEKFTVIVSGLCKSAGTLLAVGAHELAFAPYGELGPIDIQTYKVDNLAERQSGLTITEALENLVATAVESHGDTFSSIMRATGAVVSFQTASSAATELVNGLFAPIFAQIDPYDVGDKARSMRIAADYGERLSLRTGNLKKDALECLTRTYPSHSFVIDMSEARALFENVRELDDDEVRIVECLGRFVRVDVRGLGQKPEFRCISESAKREDNRDARKADIGRGAQGDGPNSKGTAEASDSSPDGADSTESSNKSRRQPKRNSQARLGE